MLNFCYLETICSPHPYYHVKIIGDILKAVPRNNYICLNEFIWLMTMKMRLKIKNRSYRHDINRPRSRHRHACPSILMAMCFKQHLSNIWSSIYEKWRKTEAELKKKTLLMKKTFNFKNFVSSFILHSYNFLGEFTLLVVFSVRLHVVFDHFHLDSSFSFEWFV